MTSGDDPKVGTEDPAVPLYQQIKRWILDTIERGEYDPDVPFTTERELRERFGVSTATAVRALNDLVNEGVLVRQRARGTFVADPAARKATPAPNQAGGRSIAYVTYGHSGPHGSAIMQGISAACVKLGYRLFVTDTANAQDIEAGAIRQAIDSGASGVLWYPLEGTGDLGLTVELARRHIPLVFIDRYLQGTVCDAVVADNFAVGYEITGELVRRGHQRIATLWSESHSTSVIDRLSGHVQALREHKLPVSAEFTALRSYVDMPDERRHRMLRGLLEAPEPATVMLCSNGYVLAKVAHDLVSIGLRIPEDIELAGMDDAGPYDLLSLASVAAHLPSRQMGEVAMTRLHERITDAGDQPPEHVVLPITLRSGSATQVHLRPVEQQVG